MELEIPMIETGPDKYKLLVQSDYSVYEWRETIDLDCEIVHSVNCHRLIGCRVCTPYEKTLQNQKFLEKRLKQSPQLKEQREQWARAKRKQRLLKGGNGS